MHISRLTLHNWKNFQHCTVDIPERCFIVGANATGKSNLLDALRFLRDVVRQGGGLQTAVEQRGGIRKLRCLAARTRTDVGIEIELSEDGDIKWHYELYFKHSGGGIQKNEVTITHETVLRHGAARPDVLLDRTDTTDGEDADTLKFTHLEQPMANQNYREIRDFFEKIEYLNIIPQMVRESGSVVLTSGKEDYFGRNFLLRLARLNETTRKAYFRRINELLRLAVPQLEELTFVKDQMGIPHLEARYVHWRARGSKQNEMQFSDGTLRLIGFLFALLDGNGTVLLEEPEINLNSAIVAQIPEFIASIQRTRRRQVIVTTHSYDLLANRGISSAEVLLLKNTDQGTTVTTASQLDSVQAELEAGFTVAEAVIPQTRPVNISDMSL